VYFVSPSNAGPFSLSVPPAVVTSQVYIAPIRVFNGGVHSVTLVLTGTDTLYPAGPLTLAQDEHVELWSFQDPVTNAWGYVSIR